MSCPSWFPSEALQNPVVRGAKTVLQFIPICLPFTGALDVGFHIARGGCTGSGAMCSWARDYLESGDIVLRNRANIDGALSWLGLSVPAEVWAILQGMHNVAAGVESHLDCNDDDDGDDVEEASRMNDDDDGNLLAFHPIMEWSTTAAPPSQADYRAAYREAMQETETMRPGTDFRPWFVFQANADLRYLQAQHVLALHAHPGHARVIAGDIAAISGWLDIDESEPPGPWPIVSVRRVLFGSPPLPQVPPTADDDERDEGGGFGFAPIAAAAAALLLLFR